MCATSGQDTLVMSTKVTKTFNRRGALLHKVLSFRVKATMEPEQVTCK